MNKIKKRNTYILGVVKRNPLFFHSISCKNNGFLFTTPNIYIYIYIYIFIYLYYFSSSEGSDGGDGGGSGGDRDGDDAVATTTIALRPSRLLPPRAYEYSPYCNKYYSLLYKHTNLLL